MSHANGLQTEQNMENLGKTGAWQIRDFPEALRLQIIEAAKATGATVPEFVTRIMVQARDAGWFDGLQTPSNAVAVRPLSKPAGLEELATLAGLARDLAPEGKDTTALRLARRAVAARLKALVG
jgi:hypothetical protein